MKEILEKIKKSKSGSYATGGYHLAMLNQLAGTFEKAKNCVFKIDKGIPKSAWVSKSLPLSNPNMNLGSIYVEEGSYEKALGYFFKALESSSRFYGEKNNTYRRNLADRNCEFKIKYS